ncbi:MAG: hypothetical protein O3C34_21500 [Proteobacteria bacterium]|nr:hypothetical protein [Pseudomonadota bacterium]
MADKIKRLWLVLALLCGLMAPTGAFAADQYLATAIQQLGAASYNAKIKAINTLAATGDERVAAILEAYLARNLYRIKSDKRVVIATPSGDNFELVDPLTMARLPKLKESDIKKLRLNNRVRRVLQAALGGLTLVSKDPAKRFKAAQAVFKAPKAEQIAVLRKALEREQDAGVKTELVRALAAAELTHGATADIRIAAVRSLGEFSDPRVMGRLRGLLNKDATGQFMEPDAALRAAAQTALSAIEEKIALWDFLGKLFQPARPMSRSASVWRLARREYR